MNVGIIGFGTMGEAAAAGLKRSGKDFALGISEKVDVRRHLAVGTYGAEDFTDSLGDLVSFSDVLIAAIKPQDFAAVSDEIGPLPISQGILSVMAGIGISTIRKGLETRKICRCMPNLAAAQGKALIGASFSKEGDEDQEFKANCLSILSTLGTVLEVKEKYIPAVTGVSGSGIAYAFAFAHALCLGGVHEGLPYPDAVKAAIAVLDGAAKVMEKSGEAPSTLITRVTSPEGTTIRGIKALEENGFTAGIMEAVARASGRAKEMEG
jgi:pyrroline-5-carboxylate reductase